LLVSLARPIAASRQPSEKAKGHAERRSSRPQGDEALNIIRSGNHHPIFGGHTRQCSLSQATEFPVILFHPEIENTIDKL